MTFDDRHLLEALRGARALISAPDKWTQETETRDMQGIAVKPTDPLVHSRCLSAAIRSCSRNSAIECDALWELMKQADMQFIPEFNDNHSHEEVLELVDSTIKRLKDMAN